MVLRCTKNGKKIICALFSIKFDFVLCHISLTFIFLLNTRSGESLAEMIFILRRLQLKGLLYLHGNIVSSSTTCRGNAKKYTKNSQTPFESTGSELWVQHALLYLLFFTVLAKIVKVGSQVKKGRFYLYQSSSCPKYNKTAKETSK